MTRRLPQLAGAATVNLPVRPATGRGEVRVDYGSRHPARRPGLAAMVQYSEWFNTAKESKDVGSFSLWHFLIVLILLAVPVVAVAAVLLFVNLSRRKGKGK